MSVAINRTPSKRFEGGVIVVGAEVMGVPGDYILDTATPHTQLADSQAQTAGFTETALTELQPAAAALPPPNTAPHHKPR